MSDNNTNHDENELPDGDTRLNKPENKETSKKDSENSTDPSSESDNIEITKSDEPGIKPVIKDSEEIQKEPSKEEPLSEKTEDIPEALKENSPSDTEPSETIPEKPAEDIKKEEIPPVIPKPTSKPKESNYQISLIDENLLRVVVSTNRGVKIDSTVKEDKASTETQSNEINLHPGTSFSVQEVEVLIAIEEPQNQSGDGENEQLPVEGFNAETSEKKELPVEEVAEASKSNYQLNLINENLLKIKILSNKIVRIESTARDKKIFTQTQSSKIVLKPKSEKELQQIEITIAIEAAGVNEAAVRGEDGKPLLIPNPEVVDLIRPPDYSGFSGGGYEYQGDAEGGYQNPFDSLRQLIRKNLTIGIIAAIILHLTVAAAAFYSISKKTKDEVQEEPTRLIVLQDLPDPKIKIEDVEDPNKPKVEEAVVPPPETQERELTPRKTIRPPTITRPKKEREDVKLDSSVDANLTRELDSLRKLVDETVDIDSTDTDNDTTQLTYEIPDSLKNNFSENDIGLAMYFPKNWKLTDQRDINKNETDFKGVVLTDTTAEQPGTMTMFIFLDNENKDYNAEDFKTEFKMNDSTLSAFSKEPKTLAGFTEYRFYIFNKLGTEKLSLRASVRKQFFDQYKNEVEAVVRSIKIRRKEDM